MAAPERIKQLVEKFAADPAQFRNTNYNETQTRIDFVNPLFAALGWDMDNQGGLSENLREVVHEDKVKVGMTMKAPDYSFRIGGQRKFFVETKKPGIFLKVQGEPAYQLRRYAWTAKLPVSILTDFEEFAVYDGRVPPEQKDPASRARLDYFTYKDYEQKWDEIISRFSRAAVAAGSLDKLIETGRKGIPVDAKFLEAISGWREKIARHIAENNPKLTPRALNFAVQMILDRIIFLRICEDRGVETEFRLSPLLNGTNTYARLLEVFHHADDRYNSGLFHFKKEAGRDMPDSITGGLHIADRPIKEILAGLYYPESPFEFSVFPADILGQVYEQFLGKVIRIESKSAVVEYKPEVKKAGGVFYTPTYIVDYIVKHTVGKLLESKTPKQVSAISILDPACGSGSFLIGAYQFLLDWHLRWYIASEPQKEAKRKTPAVFQNGADEQGRPRWRLTTAEKKRILLNNIFGVDIDTQAVEVTKLSLLLKVLEGESAETVNANLKLFKERALPDLESNIQCGNSLIGQDFYSDSTQSDFSMEERYRINAFDWNTAFPKIMHGDGFDAVIGNPPWGGDIDRELSYYHLKYASTTQNHTDSFKMFVELSCRIVRNSGMVSMIVPNTILRQRRLNDVRSLMLRERIVRLVDLGENVFKGVVAPSCVFVLEKATPDKHWHTEYRNIHQLTNEEKSRSLANEKEKGVELSQDDFYKNSDLEFMPPAKKHATNVEVLGRISDLQCKDAGINYQRVSVGMKAKGNSDLSGRLLYEGEKQNDSDQMYWKGSDIDRFWIRPNTTRFCRTDYRNFLLPNEVVHLSTKVYDTVPKILFRQTSDTIIATVDYTGVWFGRSIIAIILSPKSAYSIEYFLGLLNSRYCKWLYHEVSQEEGRVFAQVKLSKIKQLPIRIIDFSKEVDKVRHDKIVGLVKRMFILHTQKVDAQTAQERDVVARQIAATDAQIDKLVYNLYELTQDEIKLVEAD